MKKLVVLQQGGQIEGDESQNQKEMLEGAGDFYKLSWNSSIDDPNADFVVYEKTKWTEGRQLIYEIVDLCYGGYEYYLFLDDDIRFDNKFGNKLVSLLDEWKPLCAAFSVWNKSLSKQQWDDPYVKPPKKVCCYKAHDECTNLFHRSIMDQFFPLPFHGTGAYVRLIETTIHHLYPKKNIRFSDIKATNMSHRGLGPGSQPFDWRLYVKFIQRLQPCYRIQLRDKRLEKKITFKANVVLGRKTPSKVAIDLTESDLDAVIDVEHPIWRGREPLLGKFTVKRTKR